LRRHPELKWKQEEAGLATMARLQSELLRGVAPLVRSGGTLVYSTCSLEPEETDVVVEAFLRDLPDFAADDPRASLPPPAAELVDDAGALRTWPHRHGIDGFYAIRLRRRSQ
jgi:16S rRNA (cytosine967-C5)-methyltransferase